MAKSARKTLPERVSFFEVVFQGSPKVVIGFLAGLALGQKRESTIIPCENAGIYHEDLREKISELIHVRAKDFHVVVDARTAQTIRELKDAIEERTGLQLKSCRHIRSAELPFKFRVFAAHYDREIMGLLHDLPEGLKLRGFEHDVQVHPEAKGTEAYAPVHDYEATGAGRVVGRIDRLVEYRKRLVERPLVEQGRIELKLA